MIHVVIPAFNEEVALPRIVTKIDRVMREWDWEYQVIVCDDGSRDGTAEVLDHLRVHYPLTVICHTINRGLGESMRDLLESAAAISRDGDVIVRMDGDDTHEPTFIPRLVSRIEEGYDVVTASRFQRDGGQLGVGAYRAFVSRCANLFMKILFPIRGVMEYSCGYRAYRASLIKRAIAVYGNNFVQLKGLGFTATLEKFVKLKMLGARFSEVGFVLRYDQKQSPSKMVTSLTTLGYFVLAILYYWPWGGWRTTHRSAKSGSTSRIIGPMHSDRVQPVESHGG